MPLYPRQRTNRADAPVCPGCGLRFEPESDRDIYCSEQCKRRVKNRANYEAHIEQRRKRARKRSALRRQALKQQTERAPPR